VPATLSLAPEWPLTIAAGILYGIWGFPITVITGTLVAVLAFVVGRHFAREQVRGLIERRPRLRAVDEAVAEEEDRRAAAAQPGHAVQSAELLFGVPAIRFGAFVAATFAGIVPGAALYSGLGMLGKAASGGADRDPLPSALFALRLAATLSSFSLAEGQ
jgi:uncharacterized membrane protein YdjX (TVP38/TMEM64 family)